MMERSMIEAALAVGTMLVWVAGGAGQTCVKQSAARETQSPVRVKLAESFEQSGTPTKRAVIALEGQYCEFYHPDVEQMLQEVQGVRELDFQTVKGHVIVTYEAGNVSPLASLTAINNVKGGGYYCKAQMIPG